MKAKHLQVKNVINAICEILETPVEPITKSEALPFLKKVGSFEFELRLIIW